MKYGKTFWMLRVTKSISRYMPLALKYHFHTSVFLVFFFFLKGTFVDLFLLVIFSFCLYFELAFHNFTQLAPEKYSYDEIGFSIT